MAGWTILEGDCREVLATLPERSVHCVVTSPPYWAQRVYSGVDAAKGIGNEPTPEAWCANLVDVFRAVKRVLRDDGTLWINCGDKYAGSGGAGGDYNEGGLKAEANGTGPEKSRIKDLNTKQATNSASDGVPRPLPTGYKPKDLIGLPWMLAFALRADGWYLRSEIIWHKLSPMPESVTDRPTRAHEQIFLLSKSPRYFYDAEAVREEYVTDSNMRNRAAESYTNGTGLRPLSPGDREWNSKSGRNLRDVWTLAPLPFSASKIEAYSGPAAADHFAVFPPSLPERCIKAGTSECGVCGDCGAPWVRQVEKGLTAHDGQTESAYPKGTMANRMSLLRQAARERGGEYVNGNKTTGWAASCECKAQIVAATVLDPFCGSGTTLMVADRLERHAIGVELSPQYAKLARQRIRADAPLLGVH